MGRIRPGLPEFLGQFFIAATDPHLARRSMSEETGSGIRSPAGQGSGRHARWRTCGRTVCAAIDPSFGLFPAPRISWAANGLGALEIPASRPGKSGLWIRRIARSHGLKKFRSDTDGLIRVAQAKARAGEIPATKLREPWPGKRLRGRTACIDSRPRAKLRHVRCPDSARSGNSMAEFLRSPSRQDASKQPAKLSGRGSRSPQPREGRPER